MLTTHLETGDSGLPTLYSVRNNITYGYDIAAHRLNVYDFVISTEHMDLQSIPKSELPCQFASQERLALELPDVIALTNITNGAFILLPAGDINFLFNVQ